MPTGGIRKIYLMFSFGCAIRFREIFCNESSGDQFFGDEFSKRLIFRDEFSAIQIIDRKSMDNR